jgi:lantibiotic modifying enzyme
MNAFGDSVATGSHGFSATHWAPILEGDLRRAGRDALFDIAHCLPPPGAQDTNASLGNGDAGFAILHAYLAKSGLVDAAQAERHSDLMLAHLQSSVDRLAPIAERLDLFSGFMGVAWAVNHLQALGALQEGDELCDAADQAVLGGLRNYSSSMLCELVAGLSGLGVYGLARWHRPAGRKIVGLVVQALEQSTVVHQGLRTWFHARDDLPEYALHNHPDGCFNLGLAHGVPGTLGFLARAAAYHVPGAHDALTETTGWLFHQQRHFRNGSRFAHSFTVDPAEEPDGSRVAWCYGDLGVSAALLLSARHANRLDWETTALDLARGAAQRRREDSGVVDAGFCHGAFGNAHIFSRMYAATGERYLLEAALHWVREGLEMRKQGTGLAGFLAWWPLMPNEPPRELWRPSVGLIDGICGIGLALTGLLAPVEPAWDEVFMLNLPSRNS